MSSVSLNSCNEGVFGGLHKVAAATTVHVDVDSTGEHVRAFGVDYVVGHGKAIAVVEHIKDRAIFDEHGAVFNPSVRGEDFAVEDLGSHCSCFTWSEDSVLVVQR